MTIEDILSALPSREELARSIGRQRQPANGDLLPAVGAFGAGLLLGAGLALMFAPKPGSALREDIAAKVGEVRDRLGGADADAEADAAVRA